MAYFNIKNHELAIDAINNGVMLLVDEIQENESGGLSMWVWCGHERGSIEVEVKGVFPEDERALIRNGYYGTDINWKKGTLEADIKECARQYF
jgi:hypothetical protein